MANIVTLPRVFKHGQLELEDIDPAMSPAEIKEHYADVYNELTQAVIEGPNYTENAEEYVFRKAVGTKGVSLKEIAEGKTVKPRRSAKRIEASEESKELMRGFIRALSNNSGDCLLPGSQMLPPI
jgi:PRTRC genetic system protein C